jgi:hypothetical protein
LVPRPLLFSSPGHPNSGIEMAIHIPPRIIRGPSLDLYPTEDHPSVDPLIGICRASSARRSFDRHPVAHHPPAHPSICHPEAGRAEPSPARIPAG